MKRLPVEQLQSFTRAPRATHIREQYAPPGFSQAETVQS